MIRKSVETRDWMNTIEPRNVRSVMKRIVEDLNTIDAQVGTLFEDTSRHEVGSGKIKIILYSYVSVFNNIILKLSISQ